MVLSTLHTFSHTALKQHNEINYTINLSILVWEISRVRKINELPQITQVASCEAGV